MYIVPSIEGEGTTNAIVSWKFLAHGLDVIADLCSIRTYGSHGAPNEHCRVKRHRGPLIGLHLKGGDVGFDELVPQRRCDFT